MRSSRASRGTRAFCMPWFQNRHAASDACSGCADPGCESALPGEQPAGAVLGGFLKRRSFLRRGELLDEFGEPLPQIEVEEPIPAASSLRSALHGNEEDNYSTTSSESSMGEDADSMADNLAYPLPVKQCDGQEVEQDQMMQCSRELAHHLRGRPTLPASMEDPDVSFHDVEVPIRLPFYSCPFRGCAYATDERPEYLRHLASQKEATGQYALVKQLCGHHFSKRSPLDFVYNTISIVERRQVPCIGMATTRRALRVLAKVYNDETTKALVCFVCGEIHSTMRGPEPFEEESTGNAECSIEYISREWLRGIEAKHPGSLLNNCSYELWEKRYMSGHYAREGDEQQRQVLQRARPGSPSTQPPERHLAEWCLRVQLGRGDEHEVRLFGITEDVYCRSPAAAARHSEELRSNPFCRRLCVHCQVPMCTRCRVGLASYVADSGSGTIPMALANDNYYGYVVKLLVEKRITWLECAAASLVWTTIMVYYLEAPYGHLMLEEMEGAQARTAARGNLFSFELPWEDVAKRCHEAETAWYTEAKAARQSCALPHDEDVLATLVNVHIVGGSAQTVTELEGATMRTAVVLALIAELRDSGYPGYRAKFNTDAAVRQRAQALYGEYGEEPFVPAKVREATEQAFRAKLSGPSLLFDKRTAPEEPRCPTQELLAGLRPLSLVGQASGKSASMAHHDQEGVFARYQKLEVSTGTTLLDQFQPQYLGLAHPFTLPLAVGSYDVFGKATLASP